MKGRRKDIEQETEFLQKWQRVVTARLTESDAALAAESRVLREKEFIQLKKDRVIIHTGPFGRKTFGGCADGRSDGEHG